MRCRFMAECFMKAAAQPAALVLIKHAASLLSDVETLIDGEMGAEAIVSRRTEALDLLTSSLSLAALLAEAIGCRKVEDDSGARVTTLTRDLRRVVFRAGRERLKMRRAEAERDADEAPRRPRKG